MLHLVVNDVDSALIQRHVSSGSVFANLQYLPILSRDVLWSYVYIYNQYLYMEISHELTMIVLCGYPVVISPYAKLQKRGVCMLIVVLFIVKYV